MQKDSVVRVLERCVFLARFAAAAVAAVLSDGDEINALCERASRIARSIRGGIVDLEAFRPIGIRGGRELTPPAEKVCDKGK